MQHLYLGSVLLATFARPCDGYRDILTFSRCGLQLRTLKANKLNILGTRFFSENLTTDLNSDERKELKNGIFMLFPRGFSCAKILSKKFAMLRDIKGPPSDLWSPLNHFLVRTLCFRLTQVTFGLKSRVWTTSDEPQGLSGANMSQISTIFVGRV